MGVFSSENWFGKKEAVKNNELKEGNKFTKQEIENLGLTFVFDGTEGDGLRDFAKGKVIVYSKDGIRYSFIPKAGDKYELFAIVKEVEDKE